MKSFAVTAVLFTAVLAAPSMLKRQAGCDQTQQPSADQAADAIRDWLQDVNTVNTFLVNAGHNSADPAAQAQEVITFANNEPKDLMVLAGICGATDEYTDAVNDLMAIFGQVLVNLQSIIDGNDLQTAVNNINQVRCCNVLPDLDAIWLEAAEQEGIVGEVQTTVPRPAACGTITC
ncbi:uncharacterized protein BCR38DRAFT_413695 [Pseudomassariella vexata]|uniref:Uncharacterized protein n=1 Tax=Pseudomassariella vexata TaxID=1141098 RepID=A0A1Y2DET3_9PEZI|nr:uncharacterized protein BCR38DRAFT_413695 [Pseudomassariella vexata]ORY57781.1 hypothetical protein BCR38DRAFT_413695 [Pseudomassariella vexata]